MRGVQKNNLIVSKVFVKLYLKLVNIKSSNFTLLEISNSQNNHAYYEKLIFVLQGIDI